VDAEDQRDARRPELIGEKVFADVKCDLVEVLLWNVIVPIDVVETPELLVAVSNGARGDVAIFAEPEPCIPDEQIVDHSLFRPHIRVHAIRLVA